MARSLKADMNVVKTTVEVPTVRSTITHAYPLRIELNREGTRLLIN